MRAFVWIAALLAATTLNAETIDFEAVAPGRLPSGWSSAATSTGWFTAITGKGAPQQWEVLSDATAPSGAKVLAQVSDDRASGRFPLAVYGRDLVDGEVRVKFKPISGSVDQAAGLVWRYQDENNYYIVRANALEDNIVLYKVEDGKRASLAPVGRKGDYGVKHTVPANAWSTLAVAFTGSRFTVSFDGAKLFEVEDPTFSGSGKVGVWTKADSVTYFDDFEVSER